MVFYASLATTNDCERHNTKYCRRKDNHLVISIIFDPSRLVTLTDLSTGMLELRVGSPRERKGIWRIRTSGCGEIATLTPKMIETK
jgi:hypothetical protein